VAARNALGLDCRIIGVVSAQAPAYRESFRQRRCVTAPVSAVIADGVACRVPEPMALGVMLEHVDSIVAVTDDEVAAAMRLYFTATHNVAEGAGALALAAALQMKPALHGRQIGLPLSGANVDAAQFAAVLAGRP
jgi:threonine dehydratase